MMERIETTRGLAFKLFRTVGKSLPPITVIVSAQDLDLHTFLTEDEAIRLAAVLEEMAKR